MKTTQKNIDKELDEILKDLPEGKTLKIDEIAARVSVSRSTISRIEHEAIAKIRASEKLRQYWLEM